MFPKICPPGWKSKPRHPLCSWYNFFHFQLIFVSFSASEKHGFTGKHGCKRYNVFCRGTQLRLQVQHNIFFFHILLIYYKVFVVSYPPPPKIGALDVGLYPRIDPRTFITDVLDEFDLDICRMGIYNDQYINRWDKISTH